MITIVLGTRPEIIKMSPIIRECQRRNIDFQILHTGQHYSYEMDRTFFEQLELPEADFNLDVGSGEHGEQTAKILTGVEKVLMQEKPDIVLVQGDTNTVMAGALAASKLHINVGHVEAGLRSFDRTMPEEINRIVADHISDYLFAPTKISKEYLLKEGIPPEKIHVVGNTIVDSVFQNLEISKKKVDPLRDLEIREKEFFLVTSHRAENVDVKERFQGMIKGLQMIREEFGLPVIYPIHPRSKKCLEKFGMDTDGVDIINPVGFLEFLQLEEAAKVVLTDSGGVQEETCILGTPCVTLRDNTERPETIDCGSNVLAGIDPKTILGKTRSMIENDDRWNNPFGKGDSALKIIDIIERN